MALARFAVMRRNVAGAMLVAAQIAVTLAILCNGVFIIRQDLALSERPSGADEADVFAMTNQWVGEPQDLSARLETDLAALRAIPGVVDVYATNAYPLSNSGSTDGVGLRRNNQLALEPAALYFADEHALNTLGLRLVGGRNFTASEVSERGPLDAARPPAVIVTRALADRLFPHGDALGQPIFLVGEKVRAPIVGVVERLQVPWTSAAGWGSTFNNSSMLQPYRFRAKTSYYIVRARSGLLENVMRAALKQLFAVNRARVLSDVRSLSDARKEAYRDDRGYAIILAVVCCVMLAVTAFGIVGMTSYWVGQRRREIGIRRALGATRGAIVRQFQTENLLIVLIGSAAGIALALGLNLLMVSTFELARLPYNYLIIGFAMVVVLAHGAGLWPALRAALKPPALATRAV